MCAEPEDAKTVTFDKNVNTRSVTKQGDLYEAAGSLTGGSRPASRSILERMQELKEAEENLQKQTDVYTKTDARLKIVEVVGSCGRIVVYVCVLCMCVLCMCVLCMCVVYVCVVYVCFVLCVRLFVCLAEQQFICYIGVQARI